jgi:hypothetical protein
MEASPNNTDLKLRQFLVNSLRAYLAGEKAPPEKLPSEAVDWAALAPLTGFHRVAPLLALALQAGVASAAPDSARDALAAARANASRNLLLTGELARLVKQLDARGIPAIPYKGPTLAALLYGDPALRHYSDLDLLVQPQDLPAAKQAALALGYRPGTQDTHHAIFLSRGHSEIKLELHWAIMREDFPLRLDLEGVWERCGRVSFGGLQATTLSLEDLLLVLCVHGANHWWLRLQWTCDVAQLIRRYPALDWAQVMARAKSAGGQRILFLGISLAHDLLGAPRWRWRSCIRACWAMRWTLA